MRMIWLSIKLAALSTALRIVHAVLVVDGFIMGQYQRFVADPLQFRGVSLALQVRSCFFIGSLLVLVEAPFRLLSVAPFIFWMAQAVLFSYRHLEPRPDDAPVRNPSRLLPTFSLARLLLCFVSVPMLLTQQWYWLFILCAILGQSCDPKNPRLRRTRVLKLAMGGI